MHNEAFRDHWGSTGQYRESWEHFIGFQAFRPAYSFLAYENEEPLGLVIGHEYDIYTEVTGRRELYVPTVGTRRAGRKRGIATALLDHDPASGQIRWLGEGYARCRRRLAHRSRGLYQRIGFALQDTWITHRQAAHVMIAACSGFPRGQPATIMEPLA